MRQHRLLLAVLSLSLACTTQLDRSNPYDPNAPDNVKAKATLRGKVAAASLTDLSGLTLSLTQNNVSVQQQTTDDGGAFVFQSLIPGAYSLTGSIAGFVPLNLPVTLAIGADVDLGTVTLSEQTGSNASTVQGTVTLTGATDHSGTLVEAVGRAFTTVTDSSGAWRLQLVAGTYTLRFTHVNYVTTTASNVVVAEGQTKIVDAFALLSNPATLTGQVLAELASGGTGPASGVSVTLDPSGINSTTASDGTFTLSGIPAGSYVVRAQKTGYATASATALNLLGGETRALPASITLPLARGSLSGKVTLAGQTAHSGTQITLAPAGGTQLTGADGEFSFSNVLVGTYEISAQHDGFATQVLGSQFVVASGANTDAGSFTLLADPASITLHVDGEIDGASPQPLLGALCSIDGTSIAGSTDVNGAVTLTGISPGSYAVRCASDTYVSATVTVLDLSGGEARTLPDVLTLSLARGAISGMVTLSDTSDASGVTVEIPSASRSIVTGADGAYVFDRLLVGSYAVAARKDGYLSHAFPSADVHVNQTTSEGAVVLAAN
ncbi:MAG: carboxypeptidase regulatory-like domain-containing protein, partial [Deltaproteobacteria bacterium]|nr:carboxypeptidase regulatory-like domain-containing protein [Deltaproteobacteria bacterium]